MEQTSNTPRWIRGKQVDEVAFVEDFLKENELVMSGGTLCGKEGRISDQLEIKRMIYDKMKQYVFTDLTRRVDNVYRLMAMQCRLVGQKWDYSLIHVANGTMQLGVGFSPEKQVCRHRLQANYVYPPEEPTLWLRFLDELLNPVDILTLQEFMGYCLIPTTKAQKMLIITGNGGEGKSRIGVVMKSIFGNNLSFGSISKLEKNRFARADLEHLLVMVDDDLQMEALKSTGYLKSIITAEEPMDLERKGEQSYQGLVCARLMAFGNGVLRALHDRSYGFFRRQIILKALPLDATRQNDPFLADRLKRERDAIFMWCLEGLYRLVEQDFQFTLSQEAQANMLKAQSEGNNILDFLGSTGYISFDFMSRTTSRDLYQVYSLWCRDNALTPMGEHSLTMFLREHSLELNIDYSNHIPIAGGRYARGFKGIRILE